MSAATGSRACRATRGAKRRGAKLAVNDWVFDSNQNSHFGSMGLGCFFYHCLWDVLPLFMFFFLSMYGIFTTI